MKRIAAVLTTSTVLLLGSTGVAHADTHDRPMLGGCGGGYVGPALSTHLHYRAATWAVGTDPDAGTLGLDAPRRWSFVRTPQGEGRFHDPDGHVVLSLRPAQGDATPEALMAAQVEALAGTSGLAVTGQHTKVVGTERWSTLAYRWTDSMGEPRSVKQRWIAFGTSASDPAMLVLTVAGRPLDGRGLDALLAHVAPTAVLAG